MAEAFARKFANDAIEVWSAGSHPGKSLHPQVVQTMTEAGIDLIRAQPKGLNDVPQIAWDYLITMGCGDECPMVRATHREDWNLPNPKNQSSDTVRQIRDDIRSRVEKLIHRAKVSA